MKKSIPPLLLTVMLFCLSFTACVPDKNGGKKLLNIELEGVKSVYYLGETFDMSLCDVVLIYDDGSTQVISAESEMFTTPFDTSSVGLKQAVFVYGRITIITNYTVTQPPRKNSVSCR